MRRTLLTLSLLFLFFVSIAGPAKKDSSAHRTRFFILAGASWAAIDLARYNDNVPKLGINGRLYGYLTSNVRLAGEYTYTLPHNDDQTWLNIKAQSYELNIHINGIVTKTNLGFYAFSGACMQQWKGEFTGLNDLKGYSRIITPGTTDSYTSFLGNFGCGFEKNFRYLGLYGEFKFRLGEGDANVRIRINDVVYGVGLKANIPTRKLGKLFRGPGDIYHWF